MYGESFCCSPSSPTRNVFPLLFVPLVVFQVCWAVFWISGHHRLVWACLCCLGELKWAAWGGTLWHSGHQAGSIPEHGNTYLPLCAVDSDCAMDKSFWLFKGVAAKIQMSFCLCFGFAWICSECKRNGVCSYGTHWMSCWRRCCVLTEMNAHWTAAEETWITSWKRGCFVEEEQWAAAMGACIALLLEAIRQPHHSLWLQNRNHVVNAVWTWHGFSKAVSYPELRHTASHCQGHKESSPSWLNITAKHTCLWHQQKIGACVDLLAFLCSCGIRSWLMSVAYLSPGG